MPNPFMIDEDGSFVPAPYARSERNPIMPPKPTEELEEYVSEPACEIDDSRTTTLKLKLQVDFDDVYKANLFIASLGEFLVKNAITIPDGIKPTFVVNGEAWGWQDSPDTP